MGEKFHEEIAECWDCTKMVKAMISDDKSLGYHKNGDGYKFVICQQCHLEEEELSNGSKV